MNDDDRGLGLPSVQITENMGEWFVRIVRNGRAYITTFEIEAYARSYAEGQRLGLVRAEAEKQNGLSSGRTSTQSRLPTIILTSHLNSRRSIG